MLPLLLSAAILGAVIVIMEGDGEFPGWLNMIFCVLAAVIPMVIINALLPPMGRALGVVAGGLVGGLAISWRCGMSYQRAAIAAGIWLVLQFVLQFLLDKAL
ncbi:MAG TPA: hypothetical protein VGP63_11515 [Planctomycetaceae bacterium]|jgi:hypothetical protein|nr:hypothetical protein [Planctomycetaceae bacterium]